MADMLFGDFTCKENCKYVLYLEGKVRKAEEQHRNKCAAYDKLLYTNTDLRQKNTALRAENAELTKELNAERRNTENVSKYKSQIEELKREKNILEVDIRKYERQEELVAELRKTIEEKEKTIEALTSTVKKQEIRINMDSTNSSKPSSTNPPEKKIIQNNRKPSGNKVGARPNHPGHVRSVPNSDKVINQEIILEPDQETIEKGITYTGRERHRTVSDIEIIVKNTTYISREYIDSDGKRHWVSFPENISHNESSYGSGIKALLYFLLNRCNVSIGNAQKFITELSGGDLHPSTGFIQNLMKEFSRKSKKEADEILKELIKSPYMHADFTNAMLNGKNKQVLVCSNGESVLYLFRDHKGHQGIKGSPVETYLGILIHDHDITFYSYGLEHQECIIHELRYLAEVLQNEKELTWAKKMIEFYIKVLRFTKEERAKLTPEEIQKLKDEYLGILDVADKEYEANPPKEYFRKGYCLSRKMREYVDSELRFLSNPDLPRDNNCAERAGRKFKRKQHTMTTFRSAKSAEQVCQGLSVIHTASAKGENLFNKLKEIFDRPTPPPVPQVTEDPAPAPAADAGPEVTPNSVPDDAPAA
jgi:hypothetical protein